MGISLVANGALESLRDRVAFPIKAAGHWNSTRLMVNPTPLWHHTRTSIPGRPPWGRQGIHGMCSFCLIKAVWLLSNICSHGFCVMVKMSYLNEF